jgi:hypothetical protein
MKKDQRLSTTGNENAGRNRRQPNLRALAARNDLDALIEKLDRDPTEPMPVDIINHLSLGRFPDARKVAKRVSAPKGYVPRLESRLNLPVAKAIARPEGKPTHTGSRNENLLKAYVPPHLAVRTVPRLRPFFAGPDGDVAVKRSGLTAIGMDLVAFPWSAIGHIRTFSEGKELPGGTAFMVGPNLLMTASHVMPWDYSGNCQIEFTPAMYPGHAPRFGSTWISDWYGVRHDGFWDMAFKADASDYVICRTIDPIGNVCGWLGTQAFDDHDKYFDHLYMSAGYPDFAAGYPAVELAAFIRDVDGDKHARELETTNFAGPGWSGGPLFGFIRDDWRVVGVCHGQETEFVVPFPPWNPPWNVNLLFAGGDAMVDLVYHGYANYNF